MRVRTSLASLATLLAVWVVFTWPLLTPFPDQRLHVVEGGFTNQFYPYRHFTADQIHRLRPPMWNPYIFGGHPFQADPQTAVLYPPALLTAAIFGAGGSQSRRWRLSSQRITCLHLSSATSSSWL